jgi:aerobic carbon-monoxide dehydrogenase large subunit
VIGSPARRREDVRVLRGRTSYVDDIDGPRLAHAAFVRSPHAHARIVGIDLPTDARGLIAVVTADDLAERVRPFPVPALDGAAIADEPHPILACEEVLYVGQPIAAVIAESRALAEDAAELVEVEYEQLDAMLDARASDLALLQWSRNSGDLERAFASAAHTVRGRYALPRLVAAPIEARGCVTEYNPDEDRLTVWCSAQDTHRPLGQLAHILQRRQDSIRVVVPDVGGAFGGKGVIAAEIAALAAATLELGRPLKWTEDRFENFLAAYQGRGIEGELELALDGAGRMLGLRVRLWADLGAYLLSTTAIPPHTAAKLITGCYAIPAAEVVLVGARTHKVPTGPYRGAGRPEAAYMIERIVDDAARALGIDRIELRRRNLIRSFPHQTALGHVYDSGDYERCLDLALELSSRHESTGADPDRVSGTGVALFVERAGGQWEAAEVEVSPSGRVIVRSSCCPHGQGHETTFAQIAADRLGLSMDQIELRFGDSSEVPRGVGTFGSRSVAVGGSAVVAAIDNLIALADRTRAGLRPGLRAFARFESELVFSSGAYAAGVEIERSSGRLHVLWLAAVDDAGNLINPLLSHGQVIGGVVQGLGECLVEEAVYDDAGQPLTASLMHYSLLTAADIPVVAAGAVTSPSPLNPLGAKGVGEAGAIGTLPAVANAVADALGGIHVDPPYTDEKLWRALQK